MSSGSRSPDCARQNRATSLPRFEVCETRDKRNIPRAKKGTMRLRRIGNSDLQASVIGFGTWALAGDFTWGVQDASAADAALKTAYELGVNFFDTAEIYGDGRSEEILGKALGHVRHRIIIATKARSDHLAPEALRKACEGSLRRLGTDYIDLYQLHWPRRDGSVAETIEALERLRNEGKIRWYGLSNFGPLDLDDFLAAGGHPVSNQLAYSLLFRAVEYEILPKCRKAGLSIIPYSPLMEGLLTGKFGNADSVPPQRARTRHFAASRPHTRHGEPGAEKETFETISAIRRISQRLGMPMNQLALAWLLSCGAVATVIAGARNPEQVRGNAAAQEIQLAPEIVRELSDATEPLKQKLGPNADMWQSDSRIR